MRKREILIIEKKIDEKRENELMRKREKLINEKKRKIN